MGQKTLEILRIEAGIPRFGAEIDETVLPAEARLGRAVSQSKGCYVGQEVVARMLEDHRRKDGKRYDVDGLVDAVEDVAFEFEIEEPIFAMPRSLTRSTISFTS